MKRPVRKDSLLNREQLEKLNTKRLIAYKNSLLRVIESSGADIYGDTPSPVYASKQSPEWLATMQAIREILSTREHVERTT